MPPPASGAVASARDRGPDRRRPLARQREEGNSAGSRPARDHLEARTRGLGSGAFTRFHISDIWLDESDAKRHEFQTETHGTLIRSRWMPAWVDAVEYGKFGRATVTATLFGGMDPELYADFKKGGQGQMAASDPNLKA
jgi:hypothetical protein